MSAGPPRWLLALVRWSLPRDATLADSILGDLHEDYTRFRPLALRPLWFLAVAISLTAGYLGARAWRWLRRNAVLPHEKRKRSDIMLDAWLLDARQAARALLRRPAYTLAAAGTLALGTGAGTAIFTVLWGALLRPLPYAHPEQLVRIGDRGLKDSPVAYSSMSVPNFLDLRERAHQFAGLEAFGYTQYNVTGALGPQRILGMNVSPGFFGLLGVHPLLGRDLAAADDLPGAQPVVLLSEELWREQFGADASVVGHSVIVDQVPHLVIGVLPRALAFPSSPRLWTPFHWDAQLRSTRRARRINGVGRLRPGVTVEQGRSELETLFARLAADYPQANEGWSSAVGSFSEWSVARSRRLLNLFAGGTLLLLLIACVNVAGLAIARTQDRRHELAVRAALGAGRLRILRHFVAESLVLALAGGLGGLLFSLWATRLLLRLYPRTIPRADAIRMDGVVLLFAALLSLLAGLLVGLLPALQLRGGALRGGLRAGGRGTAGGRQGMRRGLVVTEIALAVMLAAGAGLLLRTTRQLSRIDLGIGARGALIFDIGLPAARYGSAEAITGFYNSLLGSLAATPGVEAVGATTRRPLAGGTNGEIVLPGRDVRPTLVEMREATPGFFAAVGIRLRSGRLLQDADMRRGAGVAVVSEALARLLFPEGDALGRRVGFPDGGATFEIVGVVSDLSEFGPEHPSRPTLYWPWASGGLTSGLPISQLTVVLRAAEPLRMLPLVRNQVHALDPDLPVFQVTTLADLAARSIGEQRRSATSLLGILALCALLLGAVGIYGLVSYTVAQRTRELGVRTALGATAAGLVRMVVGEGVRLTVAGVALGTLAALASTRVLDNLLFGVTATDPLTLATVTLLLLLAAVLASALPALRAAKVEAIAALRSD